MKHTVPRLSLTGIKFIDCVLLERSKIQRQFAASAINRSRYSLAIWPSDRRDGHSTPLVPRPLAGDGRKPELKGMRFSLMGPARTALLSGAALRPARLAWRIAANHAAGAACCRACLRACWRRTGHRRMESAALDRVGDTIDPAGFARAVRICSKMKAASLSSKSRHDCFVNPNSVRT